MNPNPQQLERIVAYLDGELSAEESAQVEQQLAADEEFRQELQATERAWTALDELPMTQVGDEFSRTTMEMVVDAARKDVEARTIALPIQKRKRNTTTAVLVAMALLLGALATRVLMQSPNRRLLADLPVIQNVDIYSQFNGIEFLRELRQQLGSQFIKLATDADQLGNQLDEFQLVSEHNERQAWLEQLPADEQVTLQAKLNRFGDLPAVRQSELRALHQQIETSKNRDEILQTMFQYQRWLSSIPPSEQFEYREMQNLSTQEHASEVAKQMKKTARELARAARDQEFELTSEQLHALFRQVGPFIMKYRNKKRPGTGGGRGNRSRGENREAGPMPRPEQFRRALQLVPKEAEEFNKLNEVIADALPEDVREAFQQLSFRRKVERMRAWAWQFHMLNVEGPRSASKPSEKELSDFFVEELSPAEKEELLALPRDKMREQLLLKLRGKYSQRDHRGPPEWGGRSPRMLDEDPRDRRPRDRRREEGRPGPSRDGFRGRPPEFFEGGTERRPRDFQGNGPPRRRRPEGPPPPEERDGIHTIL